MLGVQRWGQPAVAPIGMEVLILRRCKSQRLTGSAGINWSHASSNLVRSALPGCPPRRVYRSSAVNVLVAPSSGATLATSTGLSSRKNAWSACSLWTSRNLSVSNSFQTLGRSSGIVDKE